MLKAHSKHSEQCKWFFASMFVAACFYMLGKSELFFHPRELTMTSLDQIFPFIPETVWIYKQHILFTFCVWLLTPNQVGMKQTFITITFVSITCCAFFVFIPTTFPRHMFPLSQLDPLTMQAFKDLRSIDSPTNCFPSMHVALCWGLMLRSLLFLKHQWSKLFFIIWALLITISTLTTKQHYVIDVIFGVIVGFISWYFANLVTEKKFRFRINKPSGLMVHGEKDKQKIAGIRAKVESHQWEFKKQKWPSAGLSPLNQSLIRLINETIYIEEIAGKNFELLSKASRNKDLKVIYNLFAVEERQHARGLRKILELHDAPLKLPGMGSSLLLDQLTGLLSERPADAILMATATPVFETCLDSGLISLIQSHPEITHPYIDSFIRRVNSEEAAHIAVNKIVILNSALYHSRWSQLKLIFNINLYRGLFAIPFLALDVYALAHTQGFKFQSLPSIFKDLRRWHRRHKELENFLLWRFFRVFFSTVIGAALVVIWLEKKKILFIQFWVTYTQFTSWLAKLIFGKRLLKKQGLPEI